jgi:hypothetical protein
VPHIRHHLHPSVSQAGSVLIDDRWFDNRVLRAMRDQDRLPKYWQKIIIVERAREERLTNVGWNRQAIRQHEVQVLDRRFLSEAHT